jgi:protein-S-isoprenylcysteine O-methyltransferase Ste14
VLWAKAVLNAVVFFAIFMLALPWGAHYLLPSALPLPVGVAAWLAGALAIFGAGLWSTSLACFVRQGRGTPLALDAPRDLVTAGPFSQVRNPIMLGELSIVWAEALVFGSLGVALYAVAVTALAHLLVVHVEEPELRTRFGPSYEDYVRRVGRWLPRRRPRRS